MGFSLERQSEMLQRGFQEFDKIEEHKAELKEKYEGEIVAVREGEPVASAGSMEELKQELENKEVSLEEVYTYSFLSEDLKIIL